MHVLISAQEDGADLLLDEFLLTALRSVKDRLALLKIEQEIERLVRDGRYVLDMLSMVH
jgi:hypothetical protein